MWIVTALVECDLPCHLESTFIFSWIQLFQVLICWNVKLMWSSTVEVYNQQFHLNLHSFQTAIVCFTGALKSAEVKRETLITAGTSYNAITISLWGIWHLMSDASSVNLPKCPAMQWPKTGLAGTEAVMIVSLVLSEGMVWRLQTQLTCILQIFAGWTCG